MMSISQFIRQTQVMSSGDRFSVQTDKDTYIIVVSADDTEAKVYVSNGTEKELLKIIPSPCCSMHLMAEAVCEAYAHYSKPEVKIGKPNPRSPWVN